MPVIDVSSLTVAYDSLMAVNGISFQVAAGEIVALLGPNGAGKTTTMEVLEGYRTATTGSTKIDAADGSIGVLLQEDGIYPAAKPRDVLALFRALYGDAGPTVDELLQRVGLTERSGTTIRRLSGGEKRRLGLALALCGNPEALLLDEPTSGVDHAGRALLRAAVREAADAGAAVLITTHELNEAQRLADRLVIIDKGAIVAEGTPDDLTKASQSSGIRFTAEEGLDLTYLVIQLGAQITEVAPGDYHAATRPTPEAVAKLTAYMADREIMLGEVRAGRHRLEDVFELLTSSSQDVADPPT